MSCVRTIRKAIALGLFSLLAAIAVLDRLSADPQRAEVNADTSGGYARLVFALPDDVDASVQNAGSVLIISFAKPVIISPDNLSTQAPDYVTAARRDPDGKGIRLALARKVTVSSLAAGRKFFVDLLPDTWSGPPPGLPQEVIAELSRRAREAERLERLAHANEQKKKPITVRVRVASQPTFTRYVFDVPEQIDVTSDRAKERLTLTFDAPLAFDLADAQATLPATVAAINTVTEQDTTLIRFSFLSKVDVRTFRDGKGFVVDVVTGDAATTPTRDKASANVMPGVPPELTSPANAAVEGASAAAAAAAPEPEKRATVPAANVAAPASAPTPAKPAAAPQNPPAPNAAAATANPPVPNTAAPAAAAPAAATAPAAAQAPASASPAVPAAAAPVPAAPAAAAPAAAVQAATAPAASAPAAAAPTPAPPARSSQTAVPAANAAKTEAPAREGKGGDTVNVELSRQGATLKLLFPFLTPTAAAIFHRADMLWIVLDSKSAIDLSALDGEASRTIRGAEFVREGDAGVVRIRLDHPHLSSLTTEGPGWALTIGDTVADPTRALDIGRNLIGPNRASVSIAFDEPQKLHRIRDPEAGDNLVIITAFPPARGFINEQDFVEFRALASTQGVAIEPLADDLNVELAADKIVIGKPGGLTLSSSLQSVLHGSALHPVMFDSQVWGLDRHSTFIERQSALMAAAAAAPAGKRMTQRLDLARFYIARDMYPEAKGVLDVVLADDRPVAQDVSASVLRAVAEVMMNRPDDALKDLSNPAIGDQHDAPLWRALSFACQGKWGLARDSFKRVEAAIATLPIELQRVALKAEMRTAVEVGDFAGAADELNDLETIGLPRELQPTISVLVGRLAEGMGRNEDALAAYRTAADSWDRPAAAQGKLREAALRYKLGDLKREEIVAELETLTTVWRGDESEIGALEILARLYTDEGRYRDSFYVMRSAATAHPDSDMTRRIQDEAAATFEALFLAGKGDAMSAIDALALFYDFRELTPIGRHGDEMIRRLADRLVSVDLLDQAANLLQYQVDRRLQGAARAQVATRLAVVYLMNHQADRALATLRATRSSDLANELRSQRLLLEARALSDLSRYDLALEVIANIEGREAIRLRSDILWSARRWTQAAEQIELYYGERWKEWPSLNEVERSDILRATIGYALGEDVLGLSRFREKYVAKMMQTPDARAFEIVSAPLGTNGKEFGDIARAAASIDTLESFLRDMQARYPDAGALPPATPAPQPNAPTASAPANTPATSAPASAAPGTTGAVSSRAHAKTAQR
jgi:predicted negative regulator of RcsB-dependent stress response